MGKTGFFLVLLFLIILPVPVAALQCLAATDCPPCGIDGAVLTGNKLDTSFTDRQVLTCEYGSGNENVGKVELRIVCFENAAIAREVTGYYAGTGENPSQSEYASLYGRPRWRCVTGGSTKESGQSVIRTFGCSDFTGTGRFVATIDAAGQTEYLSSDPAAEVNRKRTAAQDVVMARIQKYKDCFSGFSPGTMPSPQEKPLHGTVIATDMPYGIPQPLKYAVVTYTRDDGMIDSTSTNEKGEYSFDGKFTPGKQYEINVTLTYAQDKDYFAIGLFRESSPDNFEPVVFTHRYTYGTDADLQQNISLDDLYRQTGKPGRNPFGIQYIHYQEVLEFYKDNLREPVNHKLPVRIYMFADNLCRKHHIPVEGCAFYEHINADIVLSNNESLPEDAESRRFTAYHEFSHFMMENLYGKWPESRYEQGVPASVPQIINHDGFINPSSSDSWTEGFAEFMPAVIQEHYGHGECGIVAGYDLKYGRYLPWQEQGTAEELAFAGFLYNVYDSPDQNRRCYARTVEYGRKVINSPYTDDLVKPYYQRLIVDLYARKIAAGMYRDSDKVAEDFPRIWTNLRSYKRDVPEVIFSLKTNNRPQAGDFDNLTVKHGFWVENETDAGNGVYTRGEPFRDENGNRTFDAGELFIDLPGRGMQYSADRDLVIGTAANYNRQWRLTPPQLPGHYVRVNNAVPYYFYTVEYADDEGLPYIVSVPNRNGLIYVPIPPNPAATITIYAQGVGTGNPLHYTSQEFYADYDQAVQRGYYISHDFGINGPVPTPAPMPDFGQGGTGGSGGSATGILATLLSPTSHVPVYISVPVAAGALLLLGIVLRKML